MGKVAFKRSGFNSLLYCVEGQKDGRFAFQEGMQGDYWPDEDVQDLRELIASMRETMDRQDAEIMALKAALGKGE